MPHGIGGFLFLGVMSKRIRIVKSTDLIEPLAMQLGDLSIYSGIGKTRLRKYVKEGSLPAYLVGGTYLVRLDEFRRFLDQHRYQPDLNKIVDEVIKGF